MARATAESVLGQIRHLSHEQSFSRTKRIPMDSDKIDTLETLRKLRSLVNQAVGRIRLETRGSDFRVDSGIAITSDQSALLCTVAVTRFDHDGGIPVDDDDIDI